MGLDMRIVEVGNNILQFKFSSKYQLEWVERCGPWSFNNNILLLCRWKKGLTSTNISFTHSPFWVQIWGLSFEHMSQEVGEEIGSKLGRFIEVDRHLWQSDQAKFMRVCVDLEIDKPLRRGAYIASSDGERLWLTFKYERLPIVCFICGKLGHDNWWWIENAQVLLRPYGSSMRKDWRDGTRGTHSSPTTSFVLDKGRTSILNLRQTWSSPKHKEQIIPLRFEAFTNRYEAPVQIK